MREFDMIGLFTLGNRCKAYMQALIKGGYCPSHVIVLVGNRTFINWRWWLPRRPVIFIETFLYYVGRFLKGDKILAKRYFDVLEPLLFTLNKYNIPYEMVYASDCNDPSVIAALKKREEKYVIYGGGGILLKGILNVGKKFIHVHPGIVPDYRGSTCFYYSLINGGKCGATAFFMSEKIDKGDVIAKKDFGKPKIAYIDNIFDPYMRSELLSGIISGYAKEGKFNPKKQGLSRGETYFVIHPILKHLAILDVMKDIQNKGI